MARASVGKVALRNSKRRWFRSNPAAPFAQPFQFSDRRSKPKRSADAAPVYQLEILAQAFVLIVLNDDQSRSEERRVGKECSVRVDLGGRSNIKKKTN